MSEITQAVESLTASFEEFKKANDARLKEIEKRGSADVVTTELVDRINADVDKKLDGVKKVVAEVEKKANRPRLDDPRDDKEAKRHESFTLDIKSLYERRGLPAPAITVEDTRAYHTAFKSYLRTGVADHWSDVDRKALSVGVDPDGGYLLTPDTTGQMVKKMFDSSPIRQLASVQTIASDRLEGIRDFDQMSVGWVSEQGTRAATNTAQIGKWSIPTHEVYANPQATQKLLDDSGIDVEIWLADKVADRIGRTENTAFVAGTGAGQPMGFTSYPTAATADATRAWGTLEHILSGASGDITDPDKLIDLIHAIRAPYRDGSVFGMARLTLAKLRKLKQASEYVWMPSVDKSATLATANMFSGSLLGYPVVEMDDMPAVAANALSIAFGNFRIGYQIVDRLGMRTLRDPYSNKPFVGFYTIKRVGGDVINFEAIKFIKISP